MVAGDLSPVVRSFLARHLRNLDDLHVLMTIMESADRWWDASGAARQFGVTQADARAMLERFAAHNLLDIRITEDVRYQFRPGNDDLHEAAQATLDAYRRDPMVLARAVSANRGITDFADAFRIRRDHDDR